MRRALGAARRDGADQREGRAALSEQDAVAIAACTMALDTCMDPIARRLRAAVAWTTDVNGPATAVADAVGWADFSLMCAFLLRTTAFQGPCANRRKAFNHLLHSCVGEEVFLLVLVYRYCEATHHFQKYLFSLY